MSHFPLGEFVRSISLPRLREHAGRTASTVVGVGLGVAVLIAVTVVNRSIVGSFTATIDDVAGRADLQVRAGATGFDEALADQVRSVPGVLHAARLVEQTVRMDAGEQADERLLLLGVDLLNRDDAYFRNYASGDFEAIVEDPLAFLNSPYHIVLSRSLAQRYGYALGDAVSLRTPAGAHDFEIWGMLEPRGVGSAFGGAVAIMDYAAMQVAFERGHNIDQIDVALAEGADASRVADAIAHELGPAFSVERPARRGAKIEKMLGSLNSGLTMASLVAVLVSMFLIYSTMSISVVQRQKEIGVLRALGMTRRQVLSLFTLEGVVLGVVGSSLGVVLGVLLSQLMLGSVEKTVSELFVQVAVHDLNVGGYTLLFCWLLGVLCTVMASALPALRGARVAPIVALGQGRHRPVSLHGKHRRLKDVAALILAASSVLLLRGPQDGPPLLASLSCATIVLCAALCMPRFVQALYYLVRRASRRSTSAALSLANENLIRELGRVASTASALMVGVAMALAFTSFVNSFTSSTLAWVDQMLPADLWISSGARMGGGGSVPMSDSLHRKLARLPQVAFVERVRMVDIPFEDTQVKLISMDTQVLGERAHLMMMEGSESEARAGLFAGDVAISENLARRFDVHRGDRLTLPVSGTTHSFRVAAVIVDYTSDQGSVLIERQFYERWWRDTRVDTYKLYLNDGVATEPLRREIGRRWGEHFDLFVLTQKEFRDEILALLEQTFGVMHILELVAVIIAILAVINAVLANVLDRTREYGFLRAVGMMRGQVQKMVVLEATLIGAVGALVGVLSGAAIGYVLLEYINVAQTGWYLPYHLSWLAAFTTSLPVVLAAALAGVYPARVAARHSIINALAYE